MNITQTFDGKFIMDIQERDDLIRLGISFYRNNNPTQQQRQDYYNAFIKYFDFVLNYCTIELKNKQFTEEDVIHHVFITDAVLKPNAVRDYWIYSLFCVQNYIKFLQTYIDINNLERYKQLMLELTSDIELLLANYECYVKKYKNNISLTCGGRHDVSTLDMLFVLNDLNKIENIPDIKNLSLRDIKPYRMFVIRQLLESLGKNTIGYEAIVDTNNKIIPRFTQTSWEFLEIYSHKCTCWEITAPFSMSCINKLNKWANSFVHSGYIYASYIQYYAWYLINKLMTRPQNNVLCFDGKKYPPSLYFGDIRINRYYSLKTDFENYINVKYSKRKCFFNFLCKNKKKCIVKWKSILDEHDNFDIHHAGAYIISL